MTLPASGAISMSNINTELGRTSNASINLNDSTVRGLASKPSGAISLSDFYSKSYIVTSGLILHLDAGILSSYPGSGTTWTDLSGQGRNGTLTLGPTFSSDNGGSIQFDNVDDFVNIPTVPQKVNQPFSYFSWAYLNTAPSGVTNGIWGHYGVASVNCHFETSGASNMRIRLGDINNSSLPSFPVGQWVYAGFTTTGSQHKYYVNGVLQTTWTGTTGAVLGSPGGDPVHMVGRSDETRTWNGRIATALFYDITLSDAQVAQNFNSQRSRFGV
jgi:hypothetical protein